ncbi:MAG: DNA gyrase inhibitor YacG [Gemmataceae bacterium]
MIKVRCPICDTEMEGASQEEFPFFPFCGSRCKTIDLGRWLGESYRIPTQSDPQSPQDDEESKLP